MVGYLMLQKFFPPAAPPPPTPPPPPPIPIDFGIWFVLVLGLSLGVYNLFKKSQV